jgi:hypothetical protein
MIAKLIGFRAILVSALLTFSAIGAAHAGPNNEDPEICAATAKKALTERGFKRDDFISNIVDIFQNPNDITITTDVIVWFRVKQCPVGWTIVQLSQYCQVTEIHTRDGCKIKGIPDY